MVFALAGAAAVTSGRVNRHPTADMPAARRLQRRVRLPAVSSCLAMCLTNPPKIGHGGGRVPSRRAELIQLRIGDSPESDHGGQPLNRIGISAKAAARRDTSISTTIPPDAQPSCDPQVLRALEGPFWEAGSPSRDRSCHSPFQASERRRWQRNDTVPGRCIIGTVTFSGSARNSAARVRSF